MIEFEIEDIGYLFGSFFVLAVSFFLSIGTTAIFVHGVPAENTLLTLTMIGVGVVGIVSTLIVFLTAWLLFNDGLKIRLRK